MTYTFKSTGKSLLGLRKQFGVGSSGFYKNDWWLKENFAKEKPSKKTYQIELHQEWNNANHNEQLSKMGSNLEFLHPAVLAEFLLTHYEKENERLMRDWYSRTSCVVSGGRRVFVGGFDSDGLGIGYWWDVGRGDYVGVSSARKFNETGKLEVLDTFESRILELENFQQKVEKVLNL